MTSPARRVVVEPAAVIVEVIRGVDPGLDAARLHALVTATVAALPRRRVLAAALLETPSLLITGQPTGPPSLGPLIDALLDTGSTAFTKPHCGRCNQSRPLEEIDAVTGQRICTACASKTRKRPCEHCGGRRSVGHRVQGKPACRTCYAAALEADPPLVAVVSALQALELGLDETTLTRVVETVLPTVALQHNIRQELDAAPTHPRDDPAAGSQRMIRLIEALLKHGARGLHQPVCSICARTDRSLDRVREGRRCCKRCYETSRRKACSRCGRETLIDTRTADGEGLCRPCTNADPNNHQHCSGCDRTRLIVFRDQDGQWCRSCRVTNLATCVDCGLLRPCHHANTDAPLCEHCTRRRAAQPCISCGRIRIVKTRTDAGEALCDGCGTRRETCAHCGQTRPVASRADVGPLCAVCWRKDPGYLRACTGCGNVERLHHHGLCPRCAAPLELKRLLADDNGSIHPGAEPIVRALLQQDPQRLLRWLKTSRALPALLELAHGEISHEVLDPALPNKAVQFLRAALVEGGVLPPRDEHFIALQRWLADFLDETTDPTHRKILEGYATWHHLRRLRASSRTVTFHQVSNIRHELSQSRHFLSWLDEHGPGLAACTQRDIDAYLAETSGAGLWARSALRWAGSQGYTSNKVSIPARPLAQPKTFIASDDRWELARRLVHDDQIRPDNRLAGLLLLLFAQPLGRIRELRVDDFHHGADGRLLLGIGEKPLELPTPVDEIARAALTARVDHYRLRTPDDSPWLFPGGLPGRPIGANQLSRRLKKLGLTARAARNTALLDLAGQLPPTVVSRLLGLDPNTAGRWARYANANNTAYAAALARRRA